MTLAERAAQIWPLLMFAAYHRQTSDTLTLSRLMGVEADDIEPLLRLVRKLCAARRVPDLTVIVVGDVRGGALLPVDDVKAARAEVFHHPWLEEAVPTQADFEAVAGAR